MMNLADPELELIDPTPNVHVMFLHFDKIFFWAVLSRRCVVRWSKRMYSCAGICSYEGRGGLCDIALSEPLLKLRPRKDLVETLLHEMIHAYLFVTKRDQDRDGHGPNFQAHMHRINRAAGLNISIYHDFHEEVKLYQTHWWRCNGPCQQQRPHFGIVRRSCNRPPGTYDYWWRSHQKNCGGTFIKIKEPDNQQKKSKKTVVDKPNADITKYIIKNNNNKVNNNKNIVQNDIPMKPVLKDSSNIPVKPNAGNKRNNNSTLVVTKKNVIFSPKAPIPNSLLFIGKGQTVGSKQPNNDEHKKINVIVSPKAHVPNSFVFSGKGQTVGSKQPNNDEHKKINVIVSPKAHVPNSFVFSGKGQTVGSKQPNNDEHKRTSSTDVLETVKNIWSNKQIGINNVKQISNLNKHKVETQKESPPLKVKKIDDYFKTTATSMLKNLYGQDFNITQSKSDQKLKAVAKENNFVACPVCNCKLGSEEINRHLDECLNKEIIDNLLENSDSVVKSEPSENIKKVDNCQGDRSQRTNIAVPIIAPKMELKKEDVIIEKDNSSSINKHLTNGDSLGLTNVKLITNVNRKRSRTSFDHSNFKPTDNMLDAVDKNNSKMRKSDSFKAPTSTHIVQTSPVVINPPVKIEPTCSKTHTASEQACPCCGCKLNKSVEEHLDECLSFFKNDTTVPDEGASTSYETIVIDDDDDEFDESQAFNATGTKWPCPCCLKMIEEMEMNSHLDECLS